MSSRKCTELVSGVLLVILASILDYKLDCKGGNGIGAKLIRDLLLSIGTGLIASVITDLNNTKDSQEKDTDTFFSLTKDFSDQCEFLFSALSMRADIANTGFINHGSPPQLNQNIVQNVSESKKESVEEDIELCKNSILGVILAVEGILKDRKVLAAVNNSWEEFQDQLILIEKEWLLMDSVCEKDAYDLSEKISRICSCYQAIVSAKEVYDKKRADSA